MALLGLSKANDMNRAFKVTIHQCWGTADAGAGMLLPTGDCPGKRQTCLRYQVTLLRHGRCAL